MSVVGRLAAVAFAAAFVAAVASPASAQDATAKNVALKSVDAAAPAGAAAGLDASFFYFDFKTMDTMASYVTRAKPSKRIALPQLAASDDTGEIFASGAKQMYGFRAVGWLKFPAAGDWKLAVTSNDGVRIKLADQLVLEDPLPHPDRMSPEAAVKVPAAGFVPIEVLWFQRRGSATIELFWVPPGKAEPELVPPEAYWHKPA